MWSLSVRFLTSNSLYSEASCIDLKKIVKYYALPFGCVLAVFLFWVHVECESMLMRVIYVKCFLCLFVPSEFSSASASRWVNQAHAVPHSCPACRSSAAAAVRGRSLSPPPRLQVEWEMASTALRPPAPTPALAVRGNAGVFSVLHLSVSQLNGTVSHVSSLST